MKSKSITFTIPETKYVECMMGHRCEEKNYKIFGCSKCQRIEYDEMRHQTMNIGNKKDIYELWQ